MTTESRPSTRPDRFALAVVWSVWAGMVAVLLACFLPVSSRVPLAEDWYMVPALTGNEPEFATWLWSQNNEHRVPVPRLVFLGILKATHGDFRAQGLFNIALQAAAAAGLILMMRKLRGGRTDVADAFFPLALLHWGHSVHYLFPWEISFVLPVVATMAMGGALAGARSVAAPNPAVVAGLSLVVLPLCGLVGLLFVPAMATFYGYVAWVCWEGRRGWRRDRRASGVLAASSALAVVVSGLYFIGYYTPWWNPPSPDLLACLKTALKVLSLGFGVAPEEAWRPFILATLVLLFGTGWCVVRALVRLRGFERERAIGFALFAANAVGFAFIVGWGRANWVPQFGIPSRYALLVVPAFVACFIAWELLGEPSQRRWVTRGLATLMILLVPWNTRAGNTWFADWYHEGMSALDADIASGVPIEELARRHQPFLIHMWTPEQLEQHMRWLRDAGVAPFDRIVAPPQSIAAAEPVP